MRDYGKVFTRIWESEDFRSMSEDGRALTLYLLTCKHCTIAGVFRLPDGYACEDLQWTAERVAEAFNETLRQGFANRCETSKWVWISKFLDWNPPENPNQRKAAEKQAQSVPDSCGWKQAFMRVCGPSLGLEAPAAHNPSETLSQPLLNQKQEQKQKQKQKEDSAEPVGSAPASGFAIPLNDGSEWAVPVQQVQEWIATFPAAEVEQELREMRAWSLANPQNRKTARGVAAFAVRWLQKAQDTPNRGRSAPPSNGLAGVV